MIETPLSLVISYHLADTLICIFKISYVFRNLHFVVTFSQFVVNDNRSEHFLLQYCVRNEYLNIDSEMLIWKSGDLNANASHKCQGSFSANAMIDDLCAQYNNRY